jgi:DNA-binding MarR family transcriptional regulator
MVAHQAIADRFSLSPSDLKAVDLASRAGQALTAGQIAEATGLSNSAATALPDRPEQQDIAERRRDPPTAAGLTVVGRARQPGLRLPATGPLRRGRRLLPPRTRAVR